MIKILIGGSPCTHWSIAQSNNRETEPEGMGWELFKNYLIAREKYQPDYFLYENNKSMSPAIRAQITAELGVEPILINSALVAAQNRQRLYWTNIPGVDQPEDRGVLLKDVLDATAIPVNPTKEGKAQCLRATCYKDGFRNLIGNTVDRRTCIALPVRVGSVNGGGQGNRIYSIDGKSCTLLAQGGGQGGVGQGLYAIPVEITTQDGETYPVFEVKDGRVTIKDKQYPIKLPDGFYVFRKLTVTECKRLQTVPDDYVFPVSNTQAYKMLGNGWTVDVVAHILSYTPRIAEEPLEVLSMYDGMSCGRLALNKLGANIVKYYASEIDKYAIHTTLTNFPDTVQIGNAFDVRKPDWRLPNMEDGDWML